MLTFGRTWQPSSYGSVVSTDADTFTARRRCSSDSDFSVSPLHTDRGRGAVTVGRAHRPRIGISDHDVVHDLLQRELLLVGRKRIQRRVRMVLLADLREQLEARAAILVAVFHSDLGEHTGHGLGADPPSIGATAP